MSPQGRGQRVRWVHCKRCRPCTTCERQRSWCKAGRSITSTCSWRRGRRRRGRETRRRPRSSFRGPAILTHRCVSISVVVPIFAIFVIFEPTLSSLFELYSGLHIQISAIVSSLLTCVPFSPLHSELFTLSLCVPLYSLSLPTDASRSC